MCLYPKLIKNPKYLPNKKNNYKPPICKDRRLLYVAVGCGQCKECRKQLKNSWRIRLTEELRVNKGIFVTLTFSDENIEKLKKELDAKNRDENGVAKLAVRRFLERYRKKYKKSVKHWLITELGQDQTKTRRIHLHGIIFKKLTNEELQSLWKYGITDIGYSCQERAVNYIIKYVMKKDEINENFTSKILCSAGLGKDGIQYRNNKFKGEETKEYHLMPNGTKIGLPIYYRNKLYTEEQREKLWINRLNKKTVWIDGIELPCRNLKDLERINKVRKQAQENSESLGYKKPEWKVKDWKKNFITLNKLKDLDSKK